MEDLLEISRLDAGSDVAGLMEFDAAALAGAVIAVRCPEARLEVAGPLPVRSDRRRLERILGNLVDNAARHGGGAEVAVVLRREGGDLVVVVADRGPGRWRTWSASSPASTRATPPGPLPAAAWAWPLPAATPGLWAATWWPGSAPAEVWCRGPGACRGTVTRR